MHETAPVVHLAGVGPPRAGRRSRLPERQLGTPCSGNLHSVSRRFAASASPGRAAGR